MQAGASDEAALERNDVLRVGDATLLPDVNVLGRPDPADADELLSRQMVAGARLGLSVVGTRLAGTHGSRTAYRDDCPFGSLQRVTPPRVAHRRSAIAG